MRTALSGAYRLQSGVSSAEGDHAADWRARQAETGLTAGMGRREAGGLAYRSRNRAPTQPPPVIAGMSSRSLRVSRLGIAWACWLAWSQCDVSDTKGRLRGRVALPWLGWSEGASPTGRLGGSWGYLARAAGKTPHEFLADFSPNP
jgi:hypothetical protein